MGDAHRVRIAIVDLGCGGAGASSIERRLAATDGVLDVYVNPATEIAYVNFDPGRIDLSALSLVIARTGYRPGRAVEA